MLTTHDTITGRQARIRSKGRSMGLKREEVAPGVTVAAEGASRRAMEEMEGKITELVETFGALQLVILELNRGFLNAMIASGMPPEEAAANLSNVIRRLRNQADSFETDGSGPSPDVLRETAKSLEWDVADILKQGRG